MTTTFGRISSVFVDSEKNDVYVNVVTGPNKEPRGMKFSTFQKGAWAVPEEGDIVEVHHVNGERVARWPATTPDFPIPTDLSEGDFCFKFNEGTELRFSKQSDGTFNVDVKADGDVTVEAGGNISLGEAATESLAFQNHTHDVSTSEGTVTSGTPNEDGTQKTLAE